MIKNFAKNVLKPLLGALVTEEINKTRLDSNDRAALRDSGFTEEDCDKFATGLKIVGGSFFMRLFNKL